MSLFHQISLATALLLATPTLAQTNWLTPVAFNVTSNIHNGPIMLDGENITTLARSALNIADTGAGLVQSHNRFSDTGQAFLTTPKPARFF